MVCCEVEFVCLPALVSLFCSDLLLCEGTAFRSIAYPSGFVLLCFLIGNYSVREKLIISNSSGLPISLLIHSVLSQSIVQVHLSIILIFSALSNSLLSDSRSNFIAFILFFVFILVLVYYILPFFYLIASV